MVCTFFGHGNTSEDIKPKLEETLIDLIENRNVHKFYVGNHGRFDSMVRRTLKEFKKKKYPFIDYAVVLAYLPTQKNKFPCDDYSDTIYPDGLENALPKFAICKRNEWLIKQSDIVVTHVTHGFGGAALYKEKAERKGLEVINIE